ncbi:MAG: DUF4386 domain-containing protein [Cyclobacteriaceae bacterium]|nr:DUF4386 domain-containing protein [Cyclobacteriaceae bacterium]
MTPNNKTIGWLFVIGAIAVLIPYTALTIIFEYPDILRQETGVILTKFHEGGKQLIFTWFAFAITGIPLIPAYILFGHKLEGRDPWIRVATQVGVIGLIVQMVGLLRWTFVVPVLADTFVTADETTKAAAIVGFKTIHQYGGVILGEHLGQLFTITWTVMMSYSFGKIKFLPTWITLLGYGSSIIYLLAQAELFATVMPDFPVWDMAGFLGSTLWLVWLIAVGILLMKKKED